MKRFGIFQLVLLVAVVLVGAGWAFAQGQAGQDRPMMGCQERFQTMNTDKDNFVSRDEFMAAPHPRGQPEDIFSSRDADKDGKLTQEEFCSGAGRGGMGRNMDRPDTGKGMGRGY